MNDDYDMIKFTLEESILDYYEKKYHKKEDVINRDTSQKEIRDISNILALIKIKHKCIEYYKQIKFKETLNIQVLKKLYDVFFENRQPIDKFTEFDKTYNKKNIFQNLYLVFKKLHNNYMIDIIDNINTFIKDFVIKYDSTIFNKIITNKNYIKLQSPQRSKVPGTVTPDYTYNKLLIIFNQIYNIINFHKQIYLNSVSVNKNIYIELYTPDYYAITLFINELCAMLLGYINNTSGYMDKFSEYLQILLNTHERRKYNNMDDIINFNKEKTLKQYDGIKQYIIPILDNINTLKSKLQLITNLATMRRPMEDDSNQDGGNLSLSNPEWYLYYN